MVQPSDFTQTVRPTVLSRKSYNKIFCIGDNKTGTTTLEYILKLYGFHLPNQQEQEIRLTRQCFSTNYSELKGFASQYDAFQDMPFSQGQTYVAADALFPGSKFILTERNPEDWFHSLTSFHKKIFGIDDLRSLTEEDVINKMNYLYPGYIHSYFRRRLAFFKGNSMSVDWSKLYDKEHCINQYERRNEEIKRYFMNCPGKLLVIDITNSKTTETICEFLNIPKEYCINTPTLNKT